MVWADRIGLSKSRRSRNGYYRMITTETVRQRDAVPPLSHRLIASVVN
jgi:hypothetical protein